MSWKKMPCGKMYSGAMVLVGPVKTCFILFLLVHLSDFEKPLCANCYVCVRRKKWHRSHHTVRKVSTAS